VSYVAITWLLVIYACECSVGRGEMILKYEKPLMLTYLSQHLKWEVGVGPGDTVKAVDLNLHQAHLVVFLLVVTAT